MTTPPLPPRRVLWSGTFGLNTPLRIRVDAAAEAGFRELSVSPIDVSANASVNTAIINHAAARDVRLSFVDPVLTWLGPLDDTRSPLTQLSPDGVVAPAARIGARTINAIAMSNRRPSFDQIVEGFGTLCGRAALTDTLVQLESVPMSRVPSVSAALAVVEDAKYLRQIRTRVIW